MDIYWKHRWSFVLAQVSTAHRPVEFIEDTAKPMSQVESVCRAVLSRAMDTTRRQANDNAVPADLMTATPVQLLWSSDETVAHSRAFG